MIFGNQYKIFAYRPAGATQLRMTIEVIHVFIFYHICKQMTMTIKDIARYLIYNSYIDISRVSVEQFNELSELMEKFGFTVESS